MGTRSSLDLVYVDGDHSYQGAASDIAAWWPNIRPGGVMAGHAACLLKLDLTGGVRVLRACNKQPL